MLMVDIWKIFCEQTVANNVIFHFFIQVASAHGVKFFARFITWVQLGTRTNWLDVEVTASEVKVTTKPDMVRYHLSKMHLSGEGIVIYTLPSKTILF